MKGSLPRMLSGGSVLRVSLCIRVLNGMIVQRAQALWLLQARL